MKPVKDARRIAIRSYSMWANYLGIVALMLPVVLFLGWHIDTDPRIWWLSGLALILFGTVGRLIEQPDRRSWPRIIFLTVAFLILIAAWVSPALSAPVSERAFLSEAIPLVSKWEGKRNHAYLDTIASPPVWTVCYGETRGVKEGDYYTDGECDAMLANGLLKYRTGLHVYFVPATIHRRLTPKRDAAYVSLAWNVGITGAGRSTATRRLNAGDIPGGCTALTWWNRSGQYIIRGLVNRRADEYRLCMEGVS